MLAKKDAVPKRPAAVDFAVKGHVSPPVVAAAAAAAARGKVAGAGEVAGGTQPAGTAAGTQAGAGDIRSLNDIMWNIKQRKIKKVCSVWCMWWCGAMCVQVEW